MIEKKNKINKFLLLHQIILDNKKTDEKKHTSKQYLKVRKLKHLPSLKTGMNPWVIN